MHISEDFQDEEADSKEVFRFDKSLQELKDLRSQLHFAADYCEATFLNSQEKRTVVENTKEYICRALVTVVDHLGNVSANLDNCIPNPFAFSEAELRINTLKQRLLSCELYVHKLALNRVKWNPALTIYHRRYLSAPITDVSKSNVKSRESKLPVTANIRDKQEFDIQDSPLFMYTYNDKPSLFKNLSSKAADPNSALVLPARDGISILSKGPNPTFHFQLGVQIPRRKSLNRRTFQSTEIMSLIRRMKRTNVKV
ncbi:ABI-1-like 1, putative isoform 1 [Melia azedarach]|uniref:ABI-1-like 1, putative isoform 1 n=1 Tax=Melia azedarach TaxID=155640 RepID=A0ACC1XAN7_MELAZ|nr:ABI-1-like 1, putative isoform 1 [Melia azedarach]